MRGTIEQGQASSRRAWRQLMWGTIGLLLLLPLVAMSFTLEVRWTPFDFAAATLLLVGAGLAMEFASRRIESGRRLALVGAALLGVVLLLWAQGAVGIV